MCYFCLVASCFWYSTCYSGLSGLLLLVKCEDSFEVFIIDDAPLFLLKPFLGSGEASNRIIGKIKLGAETLATFDGHWDQEIFINDRRTGVCILTDRVLTDLENPGKGEFALSGKHRENSRKLSCTREFL